MSVLPSPDVVCYPTERRGLTAGDYWLGGAHSLLLVNGEGLDPSPWHDEIETFVRHGLTVLEPAIQRRPAESRADTVERVAQLTAGGVAYLRTDGARAVSILGVGLGAEAAAEAVLSGLVGNLETLILIAPQRLSGPVGRITKRAIFVVSDEDEAMDVAVQQHMMAPETTQLTLYTGDVPAAELFHSQHAKRLLKLVTDALRAEPR